MGVVDHAQQWRLLGHLAEQAEQRQRDEQGLRWPTTREPERNAHRVALRLRQLRQVIDQWTAEEVQTRKRELHLRLDATRPDDAHASRGRGPRGTVEQRGLPDARVAPHDEDPAVPAAGVVEQPFDLSALRRRARPARSSPPGGLQHHRGDLRWSRKLSPLRRFSSVTMRRSVERARQLGARCWEPTSALGGAPECGTGRAAQS